MRAFTTTTKIVAVDQTKSAFKSISRNSQTMAKSIRGSVKRVTVSMNNLNARVNGVARNFKSKIGNIGMMGGLLSLSMVVGNVVGTFANFEQANANLASVMGKTVSETIALQNDAKRLGAITAKSATEVVGLQEAYARLGFGESAILNMTESTISGSVAMRAELSDTAELVGAVVKSFDSFESVNAPEVIDQLTLSTQKSALNFEKLQVALPIVAGTANAAGVSFSKLTSLMGVLADSGIDASSSATALRKIITLSAKSGKPLEDSLLKIANSENKVKTATELFGLTAATQATVLSANIAKIKELDTALQGASGTAGITAAKQLNTLTGTVTILGSAWEGFVLSLEDGNGAFAKVLKTGVLVATEILSIASGTELASSKLNENQKRIRSIAKTMITLVKAAGMVVAAFVAFKIAVIAANAVLVVGKFLKFINVLMMMARAKGIATTAQWALNFAMSANPVGVVIIAITALIGVIYLLVQNWDTVRNALVNFYTVIKENVILRFLFQPMIAVVETVKLLVQGIQYLIANWDSLKSSVVGFYDIIKENPITQFLLKPINNAIESVKVLASLIGSALSPLSGSLDSKVSKSVDLAWSVGAKKSTNPVAKKAESSNSALIAATKSNTTALVESSKSTKKQWTGKFSTTVLKDMNLAPASVSKSLANTAISSQIRNSAIQKSVLLGSADKSSDLPVESMTKYSSNSSQPSQQAAREKKNSTNGTININVVNRTSGGFGLEVDSTGVEVSITGNV